MKTIIPAVALAVVIVAPGAARRSFPDLADAGWCCAPSS